MFGRLKMSHIDSLRSLQSCIVSAVLFCLCVTRRQVFVFLTSTVLMADPVGAQLAESPAPMFQNNLQHTGRSQHVGPQTNDLKWKYRTGGEIWASPAIDA
ncbi:MAG TPA: hypothetical protein VI387_14225, partial [Candidatus Brocadiales bacterium]|nr:hypothetical protein [Candidatus Brocadiales bacterium]